METKFKHQITFHYESIVKCDQYSNNVVSKFNKQIADQLQAQLFKFGIINDQDPKTNPQYSIRREVSRILINIINQLNAYDKPFACDVASDSRLAVDLDGNILACHGADAKNFTIGHLTTIGTETTTKCIPWYDRKQCKECPLLVHCGGGCAIATNEDQEIMCDNLRIWYGGFFAAAWYILLNRVIKSIELIDQADVPNTIKDINDGNN